MATKVNKKPSKLKQNFIRAVGRRKSSVARIRLFKGKQEPIVNNKPASEYWNHPSLIVHYLAPFKITHTLDTYTVTAKIVGGGTSGQIGAFVHGVVRALAKIDPLKFKPELKKAGFLTRDPRMKETRKVGRRGKARFKPQSPKR